MFLNSFLINIISDICWIAFNQNHFWTFFYYPEFYLMHFYNLIWFILFFIHSLNLTNVKSQKRQNQIHNCPPASYLPDQGVRYYLRHFPNLARLRLCLNQRYRLNEVLPSSVHCSLLHSCLYLGGMHHQSQLEAVRWGQTLRWRLVWSHSASFTLRPHVEVSGTPLWTDLSTKTCPLVI